MTEKEKMLAGELYDARDPELVRERTRAKGILLAFNASSDPAARLPRDLFGRTGEAFAIEPPFHCDYGANIRLGEDFYANTGCVILDVCSVSFGDGCLLGPRVCVFTATHPLDPVRRRQGLESGRPVAIGRNVWIGGNAVVNPGVTIGDDTVVGSGSVVTRSLPAGVLAAGNPARVIRSL